MIKDPISVANSTSRSRGAVGANAVTPRRVFDVAAISDSILDFGSGRDAIHTKYLQDLGFNVTAYEFGANYNPSLHCNLALSYQYDIVFASNVLNVQSTEEALRDTLRKIRGVTRVGGRAIMNYPESPRKMPFDADEIEIRINMIFGSRVKRVGGSRRGPIFEVHNAENRFRSKYHE